MYNNNPTGNGWGATGWAGGQHNTLHLTAPTIPNNIGPFYLFEWDNYEASGGMSDLAGKFKTAKQAMDARTKENAHIAITQRGKFKVILRFTNEYSNAANAILVGWIKE